MQNMSGSQLRESFAFSRRNAVLFCAALLALACALVALAPGQAHAKSYTMPKVDIQAQVETDGALQVTEQRTFDFDGDFSAVWWAFDGLPQNASLKINGVRMAIIFAVMVWYLLLGGDYFVGLKLSRRVTTRLYTPGFLLSGVKKPVRTNWNFSPGFASFRLSSSLQPVRTVTLSGFR